jgi:hypothetical protein
VFRRTRVLREMAISPATLFNGDRLPAVRRTDSPEPRPRARGDGRTVNDLYEALPGRLRAEVDGWSSARCSNGCRTPASRKPMSSARPGASGPRAGGSSGSASRSRPTLAGQVLEDRIAVPRRGAPRRAGPWCSVPPRCAGAGHSPCSARETRPSGRAARRRPVAPPALRSAEGAGAHRVRPSSRESTGHNEPSLH